ncbi:uncharacterized protein V1518DRAFT_433159 [Limtongia smithiae]|uniref:uncharacterized protein n=1 Tax=Limtongia smithiae TaxID=1125753 RepID=UPI0034CF3103
MSANASGRGGPRRSFLASKFSTPGLPFVCRNLCGRVLGNRTSAYAHIPACPKRHDGVKLDMCTPEQLLEMVKQFVVECSNFQQQQEQCIGNIVNICFYALAQQLAMRAPPAQTAVGQEQDQEYEDIADEDEDGEESGVDSARNENALPSPPATEHEETTSPVAPAVVARSSTGESATTSLCTSPQPTIARNVSSTSSTTACGAQGSITAMTRSKTTKLANEKTTTTHSRIVALPMGNLSSALRSSLSSTLSDSVTTSHSPPQDKSHTASTSVGNLKTAPTTAHATSHTASHTTTVSASAAAHEPAAAITASKRTRTPSAKLIASLASQKSRKRAGPTITAASTISINTNTATAAATTTTTTTNVLAVSSPSSVPSVARTATSPRLPYMGTFSWAPAAKHASSHVPTSLPLPPPSSHSPLTSTTAAAAARKLTRAPSIQLNARAPTVETQNLSQVLDHGSAFGPPLQSVFASVSGDAPSPAAVLSWKFGERKAPGSTPLFASLLALSSSSSRKTSSALTPSSSSTPAIFSSLSSLSSSSSRKTNTAAVSPSASAVTAPGSATNDRISRAKLFARRSEPAQLRHREKSRRQKTRKITLQRELEGLEAEDKKNGRSRKRMKRV